MNTSDLIATKIYDRSLFSYLYKRQKKIMLISMWIV
jgi:hypothetical protein